MRPRFFRYSLMGIAATLITLAVSIPASAAISNGPNFTNSVAAEQQRIVQFYQAEQSYQEKLKVGKERYRQKQVNRAKIIAGMSSELQARQQAIVIEPVAAPENTPDGPAEWFQPSLAVTGLAIGIFGLGYYRKRQLAQKPSIQKRHPVPDPVLKTVAISKTGEIFFCKASGANGRGLYTVEGFKVLKGSIGRKESIASIVSKTPEPYRVKLLDSGVMREKGETVIFEQDYLFRSPSMAATALIGKTANGWLEWKTEDGIPLDRVQRRDSNS
jgi:hypothetical protein